jgi:hypothetical protein
MKGINIVSGIAPLLLVLACEEPTRSTPKLSPVTTNVVTQGMKHWLPVGTKVPVGDTLVALPEPYDPARHGPAQKNPIEFENFATRPGFAHAPKRRALSLLGGPPAGTGDRGFLLHQNSRPWYAVYAVYDINMSLALPAAWGGNSGVYVYAPTMMPPGGACVEVTQRYQRQAGGSTTGKWFGIVDWCETDAPEGYEWALLEPQVTSWTNRYVRTYEGKPTYLVTIVTPNTGNTMGQCWSANLYDYILGGWVERLNRCGTPQHGHGTTGWTLWESWYLAQSAATCPSLPSIRSFEVMLLDPNTGLPVPFTDWPNDFSQHGPQGVCWESPGPYTFTTPIPGLSANSWRGNTPNP